MIGMIKDTAEGGTPNNDVPESTIATHLWAPTHRSPVYDPEVEMPSNFTAQWFLPITGTRWNMDMLEEAPVFGGKGYCGLKVM